MISRSSEQSDLPCSSMGLFRQAGDRRSEKLERERVVHTSANGVLCSAGETMNQPRNMPHAAIEGGSSFHDYRTCGASKFPESRFSEVPPWKEGTVREVLIDGPICFCRKRCGTDKGSREGNAVL